MIKGAIIFILVLVCFVALSQLNAYNKVVWEQYSKGQFKEANVHKDNLIYLAQNLSPQEAQTLRTGLETKENISDKIGDVLEGISI